MGGEFIHSFNRLLLKIQVPGTVLSVEDSGTRYWNNGEKIVIIMVMLSPFSICPSKATLHAPCFVPLGGWPIWMSSVSSLTLWLQLDYLFPRLPPVGLLHTGFIRLLKVPAPLGHPFPTILCLQVLVNTPFSYLFRPQVNSTVVLSLGFHYILPRPL